MTLYYVYCYHDPRPGKKNAPIYVGKGKVLKGAQPYDRAYKHWLRGNFDNIWFQRVLDKIRAQDLTPTIQIIRVYRSEEKAFEGEQYWIAKYGRKYLGTGTLLNLTDGGDGVRGLKHTKAVRKKLSEISSSNWARPSFRQIQAEGLLRYWDNLPQDKQSEVVKRLRAGADVFWEKPENKEYRTELSKEIMHKRWARPGEREKFAAESSERWKDPVLRKTMTEKLREIAIVQTSDPVWREAHSEKMKRLFKEEPERGRRCGAVLKEYWNRPENKKRRGAAVKACWADPIWREKVLQKRRERALAKKAMKAAQQPGAFLL